MLEEASYLHFICQYYNRLPARMIFTHHTSPKWRTSVSAVREPRVCVCGGVGVCVVPLSARARVCVVRASVDSTCAPPPHPPPHPHLCPPSTWLTF
jgi:hypothetical protein